jgi:hypothetical protein
VTPALRLYRRGLEIEPGNVQLLHAAAQMQMQQGQSEVITLASISHHYHHQSSSVIIIIVIISQYQSPILDQGD